MSKTKIDKSMSEILDIILQMKGENEWNDGSYESISIDLEEYLNKLNNLWVFVKTDIEALKARHTCEWGHSKGYGDEADETNVYFTSCDHAWEFMEGGIAENHVKYCPYCGGKIVEQVLKKASDI